MAAKKTKNEGISRQKVTANKTVKAGEVVKPAAPVTSAEPQCENDIIDELIGFVKGMFTVKKDMADVKGEPLKISGKSVGIALGILLVIVLILAQLLVAVKNQAEFNKKPEFVTSWQPSYGGQVGMPVYGDHLYIVDNGKNQIHKYSKMDGTVIDTYQLKVVPRWVVETSKGDTVILSMGSDTLIRYNGKKQLPDLVLKNASFAYNMSIDSKDNIYFGDQNQNKILKYSPDGKLLAEFGGKGDNDGKFMRIGRTFADANDNIYAIEISNPFRVKVFSADGKFLKQWPLKIRTYSDFVSLVFTPDGNIYVNDIGMASVIVFNKNGRQIGRFNTDITGKHSVGVPNCIAGGFDGMLYMEGKVYKAVKY
jgi:hypothetical protein